MKTKQQKPIWKNAFAFCPLCWWSIGGTDVWPDEFSDKALKAHKTEKPNCHETIRIEGK
jgi:hypothetical protein